jgi:hypothetical protein
LGEGLRGKCALGRTSHKSLRLTELGPAETASPCGAHAEPMQLTLLSAELAAKSDRVPLRLVRSPSSLSSRIRSVIRPSNIARSADPASAGI